MEPELKKFFEKLREEGIGLLRYPERDRGLYLYRLRALLEQFGADENTPLEMILRFLDQVISGEKQIASLPSREALEENLRRLEERKKLEEQIRQKAAAEVMAFKKQGRLVYGPRMPITEKIKPPFPPISPTLEGSISGMVEQAAADSHLVLAPEELARLVRRVVLATAPTLPETEILEGLPADIKHQVGLRVEEKLGQTEALKDHPNLGPTQEIIERIIALQLSAAPERRKNEKELKDSLSLVLEEQTGLPRTEGQRLAGEILQLTQPVETEFQTRTQEPKVVDELRERVENEIRKGLEAIPAVAKNPVLLEELTFTATSAAIRQAIQPTETKEAGLKTALVKATKETVASRGLDLTDNQTQEITEKIITSAQTPIEALAKWVKQEGASLDIKTVAVDRARSILGEMEAPTIREHPETITLASEEVGVLIEQQISAPHERKKSEDDFRYSIQKVIEEHTGAGAQESRRIAEKTVEETALLEKDVQAQQKVLEKAQETVQQKLTETTTAPAATAKQLGQELTELIIQNQAAEEPLPEKELITFVQKTAEERGVKLTNPQAKGVIDSAQGVITEAKIALPLAAAAKEAITLTHVPEEIRTRLDHQIKALLKEQHPSLDDTTLDSLSRNIGEAVIEHYSSYQPQRVTEAQRATDLRLSLKRTLQEGGRGIPYLNNQEIDRLAQRILVSPEATTVQRWVATEPGRGVMAKLFTAPENLETLRERLVWEVQEALIKTDARLATNPDLPTLSRKTADVVTAQLQTKEGWKTDLLIPSVDHVLQTEGIGLGPNKIKELLGKIETGAEKTIVKIERLEKLPAEILAKLEAEPTNLSLSPLYYLIRPLDALRLTGAYAQQSIFSLPRWAISVSTPQTTDPEAWKLMADRGIFVEDLEESIRFYTENGLRPSHPVIQRLQETADRLRLIQKDAAGNDVPGAKVLKGYHRPYLLQGERRLLDGIPLPGSYQKPLWSKDLSLNLKRFLDRFTVQPFFKRIKIFSGNTIVRFSFETRFVRFITFGRFSTFAGIRTATSRRMIVAFGKTAIGKTVRRAAVKVAAKVALKLGIKLGSKALLATLGTALSPGVGTVIGLLADEVIGKVIGIIKRNAKYVAQAIAGSMVLAGAAMMAVGGGISALAVGLFTLGTGSLLAMTPGALSAVTGGTAGLASGVTGFFATLATGFFANSAAAVGMATGTLGLICLTIIVIIVAAGAFILPKEGNYTPWMAIPAPDKPPIISPPPGVTFEWPLDSNVPPNYSCSSNFGWGKITFPGEPTKCRYHTGIDIPASCETPVYSIAIGKVFFSGECGDSGICVVVDHGGLYSLYGHLKNEPPLLAPNTNVYPRSSPSSFHLGLVDEGGKSTGCHLHLAFSNQGDPGSFGQGKQTPDPCQPGLLTCPSDCGYKSRAEGCGGL